MTKKEIDSIAYLIKQAKKNNKPKPIVFLGAGGSISAGIPLTGKIITDILTQYKDKPEILKLSPDDTKDYYKVMGSLSTFERHDLLRKYIESPKVKINVTHIYLAQMLHEGLIDYVLTVNFDNLLLRACALFNFIPAVYDIAILKDFTTTTLQNKSITYLHGQHHGLWLLNTAEELQKVKKEGKDSLLNVFRQICNERTWIIAGYSGDDGILDKIASLGRFDNDLFWIGHGEKEPSENVKNKLLNKQNRNAYWVPGYDSDSFFLNLHSQLSLETPEIFNKPFSFLDNVVLNIKDIDQKNEPNLSAEKQSKKDALYANTDELFKKIDERFSTSKSWIQDAIERYENAGKGAILLDAKQINLNDLTQEIIEVSLKKQYDKVDDLNEKAKLFAPSLNVRIASLYFDKALYLQNEKQHKKAIDCYEKALILKPNYSEAFNNMGNCYNALNNHIKALELYNKSIKYNQSNPNPFCNIGIAYRKQGDYTQALKYIKKSIKINPRFEGGHFALGVTYIDQKEYDAAIESFNQVLKINPVSAESYLNIGSAYSMKKNNTMAIEYLKKGLALSPRNVIGLYSLGVCYSETKEYDKAIRSHMEALQVDSEYSPIYGSLGFTFLQSGNIEKAEKYIKQGIDLEPSRFDYMNLAHINLIKGDESSALKNYKISLKKFERRADFFKGMNEDFQYLKQYGIKSGYYDSIIKKIS